MNLTIELLRCIDSSNSSDLSINKCVQLFSYSVKNRLSLLFLDAIKQKKVFRNLRNIYQQHIAKYAETFEAVAKISRVLSDAGVEYAIFKTLRPYIFTTVDIDVIIFGLASNYERAIKAAQGAGYRKVFRGPMSTTFRDPETMLGVDLYNEVAVSHVPYIDKVKLLDFIIDIKLPNQEQVKTLSCEADLISIIAHSIIKENMYTLSEYFTYIYYLQQLTVDHFIELAEKTHLKSATVIHTAITALLCKTANGNLPDKLRKILAEIGTEGFETTAVAKKGFKMPHKYRYSTIARCLMELVHEHKTRKGIAHQIIYSFDVGFSKDFFKRLRGNISRETY